MSRKSSRTEHYFSAKPKSKPRLGLIQTCLRGRNFEFLTSSGTFSKDHIDLGTRLLIESMILPEKGCVLDMGCGYGPIGVVAAALKPSLSVVMVDVNRRATLLASENAIKNHLNNVEVRRGDLYSVVDDLTFDCVLSNPPVSAGMDTVKAVIYEAPKHLAHKGSLQMVVRSKIGGKRLLDFFHEAFGNVDVLARESGYRALISYKQ
jgi:16S rRNA (guanine1207-N2)-methyltransferase